MNTYLLSFHRQVASALLTCLAAGLMGSAIGIVAAEEPLPKSPDARTPAMGEMVVVLIDEVAVPASRNGRIESLLVSEGDSVTKGQILGSLNDQEAAFEAEIAHQEYKIAMEVLADRTPVINAEQKLKELQQQARQLEVLNEIAERMADNEVRVEAAKKGEAVALNELNRALQSQQDYAGSVSRSEIEGLELMVEKGRLETKQAVFERGIAALQAIAESENAKRQAWTLKQAITDVAAAKSNQSIAKLRAETRRNEWEAAKASVEEHRLISPIDGVVVEIFQPIGSWAVQGALVIKVVRLDRLRAEGFIAADSIDDLIVGSTLSLVVDSGQKTFNLAGEVTYIHPEVDPVNQQIRVWIDFENRDRQVLPGMRVRLRTMD